MRIVVDKAENVRTGKPVIFTLTLLDNGDRRLCSSSGTTPKEAALWFVRNINRIAEQAEQLIVDLALMTDDEVAAAWPYNEPPEEGITP
jgi:hypothetical protein